MPRCQFLHPHRLQLRRHCNHHPPCCLHWSARGLGVELTPSFTSLVVTKIRTRLNKRSASNGMSRTQETTGLAEKEPPKAPPQAPKPKKKKLQLKPGGNLFGRFKDQLDPFAKLSPRKRGACGVWGYARRST